jgi:hypothetical protein
MGERLSMQRSVSQLLFHYLPGRIIDWEDGLAIVQLTDVHFANIWSPEQAAIVLEEMASLFDRWRRKGGKIDPQFPNPRTQTGQFTVGTPDAVEVTVLETAFVCRFCSNLQFITTNQLSRSEGNALTCSNCQKTALRQLGQIFVHGCGEFLTVKKWMPESVKPAENGLYEIKNQPLACRICGDKANLSLPTRTERIKDMRVKCQKCNNLVRERFTANCERCLRDYNNDLQRGGSQQIENSEHQTTGTVISHIAMRMTRYSASSTFYPQTFSILRLDRPTIRFAKDEQVEMLQNMLPSIRRADNTGTGGTMEVLAKKLKDAEAANNPAESQRLLKLIAEAALNAGTPLSDAPGNTLLPKAEDLERAIEESIAFRTKVDSQPAITIAQQGGSASELLIEEIKKSIDNLGLCELQAVDDLPMISAAFGYTRRTFEPTYDELSAKNLPTQIRAFPSINREQAQSYGRADLAGTVPILAREGEHEGLFLALCPERVISWLELNNITLHNQELPPIARILHALEDVDRYYDDIWNKPVRRFVFGLIHSLSHAAMRAASRYAGIERTSFAEYIFLPLLGTVIYDNSSSFKLGGLEALARDRLWEFLNTLEDEAMSCLYDAQCIDHRGACHGCLHSPEISCRVFNHGLSRAFLIGGHVPWLDISVNEQIIGYWQMNEVE